MTKTSVYFAASGREIVKNRSRKEKMDWIASFLTFTGLLLNIAKRNSCWPVWIASNVAWLIFGFISRQWPIVFVNGTFLFANTYGWMKWSSVGEAAAK